MDDDRRPTIAEHRMIVVAECNVRRDRRDMRRSVRRHNQRKIGNVPGGMTSVRMAARIEMRTRRLKVGCFAFGKLVNVDGVLAWRKIFDIQRDFHAGGGGR